MSYIDGWNRSLLEERGKRIREYLDRNELKAMIILNDLNTIYVSGVFVDVSTWERPIATIIPLDDEPCMILCELSMNHVKYSLEHGRGWIKDLKFYAEHPRQVNRMFTMREWSMLLKEVLSEKDVVRGKVGVDSDPKTLEFWLKPYLPELVYINASELLREMRVIKCREELDLIRKAGELTDWAQVKYKEAITIDKSWIELGAEVTYYMAQEAARRYPDYSIRVGAGGTGLGEFSAMPHGPGGHDGRKIKRGDIIINGTFASLQHYCAENERTYLVGEPSEKTKKLFEVMLEAQTKAIEMCIEDNKVSDIDSAAQEVIEKAGYGNYIMHRTGHGIGLAGHEYWDDIAFNHRLLKAGMVTSVEPGIYIYGFGGFRHSDTVIIGKDKPEVVTKFPKDLKNIIV
ncbi:aminopeptidase P family protein [Candidatus Bathyarchaeota archaeon]|nr:aminopeptidase P family protein [Candidatus Bathyarchaeota archaeon]